MYLQDCCPADELCCDPAVRVNSEHHASLVAVGVDLHTALLFKLLTKCSSAYKLLISNLNSIAGQSSVRV